MKNNAEGDQERMRKILECRSIRRQLGRERDEVHNMMEAFSMTDLPSADKALNSELAYWQREMIAAQLVPPSVSIPPPPDNAPYVIIGYEINTGAPVWIPQNGFCRGVVLIGTTGSGKTVTLAGMLRALPDDVHIYAPDSKREICRILPGTRRKWLYVRPNERYVNILDCPTSDPNSYYLGLLSVLAHLMDLDDATWPDVAAILAGIRTALPADVPMIALCELPPFLEKIGQQRKKSKFGTAAARFRILGMAYGDAARTRRGVDLASRYSAIGMDYSGFPHMIRHVTDAQVLYWYFQIRTILGHGTSLDLLFVAEEGMDFFSRSFSTPPGAGRVSIQEVLTSQGRSYGLGRMASFQWEGQGDSGVIANSTTRIILGIPEYSQARTLARALDLPEESIQDIQNLPPGEGYIKSDVYPTPLRIRVPFCDLGSYPSDAEIHSLMDSEIRWMRDNAILAPIIAPGAASDINYEQLLNGSATPVVVESPPDENAVPVPAKPAPVCLMTDWTDFLKGIIQYPQANTSALYKFLKISGYKGNKIKGELLDAGLIEVVPVDSKNGRPAQRLCVTEKGQLSLASMGGS